MSEALWLWRYKQNSVENRVFWKICVLPKKARCANSFERDCKRPLGTPSPPITHGYLPALWVHVCVRVGWSAGARQGCRLGGDGTFSPCFWQAVIILAKKILGQPPKYYCNYSRCLTRPMTNYCVGYTARFD